MKKLANMVKATSNTNTFLYVAGIWGAILGLNCARGNTAAIPICAAMVAFNTVMYVRATLKNKKEN